jgi:predicted permease
MAGMAYSQTIGVFPVFLDNTFRMAAMVTLPLALLSIGGTLDDEKLKHDAGHAIAGSVIKLVSCRSSGLTL